MTTSVYLGDFVSIGSIGVRIIELQPHYQFVRVMAFLMGFKNGTDGSLNEAVNSSKYFLPARLTGHLLKLPTPHSSFCQANARERKS